MYPMKKARTPLLEAGQGRRICCVTTVQSSNNAARDCADYPAHVSKAPLNMAMNQLFNGLRPKGYTFRMYCKDPATAATSRNPTSIPTRTALCCAIG